MTVRVVGSCVVDNAGEHFRIARVDGSKMFLENRKNVDVCGWYSVGSGLFRPCREMDHKE